MKINWGTGTEMRKSFCSAALVVCVLTAAAATAEQHYLYEPRPLAPNEQVKPDDGVLVREVVVGRGDTLSGISKRIIGRGYYYPQILLFNRISNPHLIHTGDVLRVPVKAVPPKTGKPHRSSKADSQKYVTSSSKSITAVKRSDPVNPLPVERARERSVAVHPDFARGLEYYRQGNCSSAIERFDRFLAMAPAAPEAADASLYKAECYLKLAGN